MSKEESIYIGETPTDEEMHAYFERVEDPTNYSLERWGYLNEQWMLHGMRIEEEKGWVDDGSHYYSNLIRILEQCYEDPIIDFIDHWQSEWEGNMTDEMKTWKPMNKDNYTEVFSPADKDVSEKKYAESVFIDIEHPDNWKDLHISIKKSYPSQMKYVYKGTRSAWLDISDAVMNRSRKAQQVPKSWFKMILGLCARDEFEDEDFNKELSYGANKFLKECFLPNSKDFKNSNPITVKPQNRKSKRGLPDSRIYISSIIFSIEK